MPHSMNAIERAAQCAVALAVLLAFVAGCSSPQQSESREGNDNDPSSASSHTLTGVFGTSEAAGCMAKILGQDVNKPIDRQKAASVDSLSFPLYAQQYSECGQPISHLDALRGLDSLPNLKYLDVSSMISLRQLTGLADLHHLEQINIYGTAISDVSDLGKVSALSQVALNSHVCDLAPLKDLPLQSITIECDSADISVFDGKKMQIYVSAGVNINAVRESAESGNSVTIRNTDGSFDLYKMTDGKIAVSHM